MKINNLVKIIAALSFASLSGCATNAYKVPAGEKSAATIQGYHYSAGTLSTNWQNAIIVSIDNKDVSYFIRNNGSKIAVLPGQHDFVINSTFNRTYGGVGPYQAMFDAKANLISGQNYLVKMNVDGNKINLWIENMSGKKVTPVYSRVYSIAPKDDTVMVPMYVK